MDRRAPVSIGLGPCSRLQQTLHRVVVTLTAGGAEHPSRPRLKVLGPLQHQEALDHKRVPVPRCIMQRSATAPG